MARKAMDIIPQDLISLKRPALQKLCKQLGLKANGKVSCESGREVVTHALWVSISSACSTTFRTRRWFAYWRGTETHWRESASTGKCREEDYTVKPL